MANVSYLPGSRTAMAGDACWVLISASPDDPIVTEIWRRMTAGPLLDGLVAGFLQAGFERLPDFALLIKVSDRYHVLCRGDANATLTVPGGGPERVSGAGLATWLDHPVPFAVSMVALGDPSGETGPRLPATVRIFPADSLLIDLTGPPGGSRLITGRDGITGSPVLAVPEEPAPEPYETAPGQAESAGSAPTGSLIGTPPGSQWEEGARHGFSAPVRDPEPQQDPPPASGLIEAVPWAVAESPAALAGQGEADVIRIDAVPWPPPVSSAPPAWTGLTGAPSAEIPRVEAGTAMQAPLAEGPASSAPKTSDDWAGENPAGTIRLPKAAPWPPVPPPDKAGVPLTPQDPVAVSRPVLGILRLSIGDDIILDRGLVMGRNPRAEFDGDERLRMVQLPSPDGDISRTHLKITLDGQRVLVTDLGSTNGTLVQLPGRPPERLRPNEPFPIQDGTLVTLADGIYFHYEV